MHLIVSDDDFIAANRAREIFESLSREVADDMSIEIIDAGAGKVSEAAEICDAIVAAAATVSLFGGKKVVWARNMNFLTDTPVGKSEDVKERVERMAQALEKLSPADAEVVINASPVNRNNKAFKRLKEIADFEDFKITDSDTACSDMLKAEAARLGVQLERGVAETVAAIVANNTRMALQELRKLATYVNGERPITERDAIEMVPIFGEGDFFEITAAFYSGNLTTALGALRRYFFTNKNASARPIITALQKQNSILIQVRTLMDSKILAKTQSQQPRGAVGAAANRFARFFDGAEGKSAYNMFSQNEWYVGAKLAPIAARISLKKLIDIQVNLVHAFEMLVSKPNSDELVMREFFIRSI